MADLSWSEVRDRALAFSRRWAGEASEAGGKQTFWNEFFNIFGRERRTVAAFEVAVRNLEGHYDFIDLLWKGVLLVEHKSFGKSLDLAESQAFDYLASLAREGRDDEMPRWVIVSDFARFVLYDLDPDEPQTLPLFADVRYSLLSFTLDELHTVVRHLAFIKGEQTVRLDPEDPANEKAYKLMCQLHDELEIVGFVGTDLERLLVRLLFCLFADDTTVFEPATFETFIKEQTREDGSDVGPRLNQLFDILNKPEDKWRAGDRETFAGFRYINGDLFRDRLDFPPFARQTRAALIAACEFQWARVSPAVFGSLFQGILDDKERRQQGAHYTSERDIMKVIRSLFLDDLRAEFDRLKSDRSTRRKSRLEEFHQKLRSLKFLDPACGCGNFLVIGYRELRQLELELLRERHADDQVLFDVGALIRVDVDQFHGIEISEWPVRIAEVAMWLMDHQMNQRVSQAFGKSYERLPLRSSPHIVQDNALRIDWRDILPPTDSVFVMGNPPFIGKSFMSADQAADLELVWGDAKGRGVLDYVTCWYRKAAEYVQGTQIRTAFVSTNSICQGEQVGALWGEMFGRWNLKIHFAHRTFSWMSEARGKAHVHVVIVGFGQPHTRNKRLYDYSSTDGTVTVSDVPNISPYLVEGSDTFVSPRMTPIHNLPPLTFGSKATDGGHLLFSQSELKEFLADEPGAKKFIRPYLSAEDFIHAIPRYCLWLVDAPPNELRALPKVMERIALVKKFRLASKKAQTRADAATPSVFAELRQPSKRYLAIPKTSSERRTYVPIGFLKSSVIAASEIYTGEGATIFTFGIVSSIMHVAWLKTVCGRLKSDVRYSNKLVYNNFPWPGDIDEKRKTAVETAAQAVLDAREPFLPPKGDSTLADLYDPDAMPAPLAKAHAALDRAVDRCYRSAPFQSDRERVEHLFALYEKLTAPLLPAAPKKRKRGG